MDVTEDVTDYYKLWHGVIMQAARDMTAEKIEPSSSPDKIYKWTKSEDCKEVCEYARVSHDTVRIGFIKLYLKYLDKQIKFIESKNVYTGSKMIKQILTLIDLHDKKEEAYKRWELIKCQKL